MQATAIINSYQRQPNIREIIPVLRKQTIDLHIVLVNNGLPWTSVNDGADPDDLFVPAPRDPGAFARFLAAYAYTGWLYFQDDDLMPLDDKFVEDLMILAMQRPEAITGVYGRHITLEPPHYAKRNEIRKGASHTNFVKTLCMMMHRESLGQVRFPVDATQIRHNDDTHVSLEVGHGQPVHYIDRSFDSRLKRLPSWGVGLSLNKNQKKHYSEREAYCHWWLKREGLI